MDLNNCAEITEMIYLAKQMKKQEEIKYDVSFLLYLIPEEHEWILSLNRS
jgi:hypothetical protein